MEEEGDSGPFPKTSPSSHALSLLPHSGFILSVSSRFLARKASSWASRRVELRASALMCLAKAWRSSSWGEECRRGWACRAGLGVEGELDRGGQGSWGPWGPRSSPRVSHHALDLTLTPASHSGLSISHHVLNLWLSHCLSPNVLPFCVPASTQPASNMLSPDAHEPSCI